MSASRRSIVLIGMMGAGKSSVGRCLERRTGLARFDTDEIVSARFGKSISEIFSDIGEEQFRTAETEALASICAVAPAIIVTGGGIVLREKNVNLLKMLGSVFWLDAEEDTLFERATRRGNRPLLTTPNPRQTLSEIARQRAALYELASDLRIDTTNRDHEQIVDLILASVQSQPSGAI